MSRCAEGNAPITLRGRDRCQVSVDLEGNQDTGDGRNETVKNLEEQNVMVDCIIGANVGNC